MLTQETNNQSGNDTAEKASFVTVTELPGSMASKSQLSMALSRYQIAAEISKDKDVLEVACGSGMGLGYLAKSSRSVVGLDYDPKLVEIGRKHYGSRLQIENGDAQNLPFPNDSFDVVILLEAIYYLPDARKFVDEARRVLRSDGTLFICTVNREWPDFNPSPFSTKYHSLDDLADMLSAAGFTTKLQVGFRVAEKTGKARVMSTLRRIASKTGLIPKTMAGKEKLKRLVFGKLAPMPAELNDETAEAEPPYAAPETRPIADYQVLYAIGQL